MTQAFSGLRSRFPGLEPVIRMRCEQDDEFRTLCDDFAEAELILASLERSTSSSTDRLTEYRDLVSGLSSEIASAIGTGQVIPLRRSVGG